MAPHIRILVTGSRMWGDWARLMWALDDVAAGYTRVTLVDGICDPRDRGTGRTVAWDSVKDPPAVASLLGADWYAYWHAVRRRWTVESHPADWGQFGRSAGHRRNRLMVGLGADVCVGFPLGASPGTRGCLKLAVDAHIPIITHEG